MYTKTEKKKKTGNLKRPSVGDETGEGLLLLLKFLRLFVFLNKNVLLSKQTKQLQYKANKITIFILEQKNSILLLVMTLRNSKRKTSIKIEKDLDVVSK